MKRFLLLLLLFAIIIAACDVAVGAVGDRLVRITKGGTIGRINYMANDANEGVLIFGSSRAVHHYDPDILSDSLGLSAYNCGFDGNGIICEYGFYRMIRERYYPQVLIYDISSGFDLKTGDNHKYLGHLRFFYDRAGIDSIFWSVDPVERYKMLSQMYRYNSVIPQMIMNNLHNFRVYHKGYLPIDKTMPAKIKPATSDDTFDYDSLKLHYFERLITECHSRTRLIFTVSPKFENTDDRVLEPIKALCKQYDIPLLNHFTDSTFNFNPDYFYDRTHLNRTGATVYSRTIASEIRSLLPN